MKYEQKTQDIIWKIQHDFDHQPAVKCWVDMDGDLIRIVPKDINFKEGEVEVSFSKPYSGEVILSHSKAWYKE